MAAHGTDPTIRQTLGAHLGAPLAGAVARFEAFLGRKLNVLEWTGHPVLEGLSTSFRPRRSLTAVTLATHLKREGLRWRAIDPGPRELSYWRRTLKRFRARPPTVVALSTTFVMSPPWVRTLCGLVRRMFPTSRLVVGGPFYLTSAREFLGLDADVFCLGEGEHRLPQIVKALLDGDGRTGIAQIPGLYHRLDGPLEHTGPVEPLDLDALEPVDWTVAERIEPAVDFASEPGVYAVETQRGCGFRCEFCTYRTLTCHVTMSPAKAVAALGQTGVMPPGHVFLPDATATSPRERWAEILSRIVDSGGPPHPLVAFARVSDLSEATAQRMARGGFRGVIVGQESGDQGLLNAMRKGTKVEQVPAAVASLGRAGLGAQFCFIHGFPGETAESVAATRGMIEGLNRGFEAEPVVSTYNLTPFSLFDFAHVSQTGRPGGVRHFMGYEDAPFSPQRVAEEMLRTLVAASRVPYAPLCSFLFNGLVDFLFNVPRPRQTELFRWLKAFERGTAVLLEEDLEGTRPDRAELARLRGEVLALAPAGGPIRRTFSRLGSWQRARATRAIRAEWAAEKQSGPGPMTRSYAAFRALRDLGRLADARTAWRTGTYPEMGVAPPSESERIDQLAEAMLQNAVH